MSSGNCKIEQIGSTTLRFLLILEVKGQTQGDHWMYTGKLIDKLSIFLYDNR